MSEDNLLDNDTILVPNSKLVKRLHIKSFSTQKGDAINFNSNTMSTPPLIILQSRSFLANYIATHVFNKF